MLGNVKAIRRLRVIRNGVVIRTLELHIASIILKVQRLLANIQRDKPISRLLRISTKPLGERTQRHAVVTIASLGITRTAGENKVGSVELVVRHAVVVSVDHDGVVLPDNVHQRRQLGVVGRRGDEPVVDLEDLPGRVGVGEGFAQEVHLRLRVLVALDHVVGVVHRGRVLVLVDEAVRVDDCNSRLPVGTG